MTTDYVGAALNPIKAMTITEFLARDFPPRENMLVPWLGVSSLALMYAWRGTGKTLVAHGSAWAIACGCGFLTWHAPQPWRVLLIDGEMRAVDIQERFQNIRAMSELEPDPKFLKIVAADTFRDGLPNLADKGAQQLYADVIGDADLVIADNLSTLCPSLKENDADSWGPVQEWALSLRRQIFPRHLLVTVWRRLRAPAAFSPFPPLGSALRVLDELEDLGVLGTYEYFVKHSGSATSRGPSRP